MQAIHKSKHGKITEHIQTCVCKESPQSEEGTCMEAEKIELKNLYERYESLLEQLETTIVNYNTLQRRVEVELRKQQIKNGKKGGSAKPLYFRRDDNRNI